MYLSQKWLILIFRILYTIFTLDTDYHQSHKDLYQIGLFDGWKTI